MKRLVLTGKGGCGKDFLRKKFETKGFKYQVSYTTRPPREGEVEGVDYFFITDAKAEEMTRKGEWKHLISFNGWSYGTTNDQFYNNDCPLFIFTPEAVSLISEEDRKSTFIVYLDPPKEVIWERLNLRQMPGDTAQRRFIADVKQFIDFTSYDMRVTNPDF